MRLYRTAAGAWAGNQADARALAGRDWTEIDVPTDKPGLLAWLNANTGSAPVADCEPDDAPPPAPAPRVANEDCPKCCLSPRAAETLAQGDDVEALGDFLWQASAWQLERLFAIFGHRMAQLRDTAK